MGSTADETTANDAYTNTIHYFTLSKNVTV